MKRFFLIGTLAIFTLASCKQKCVRCHAYDAKNQMVNETSEVCGSSFNMKNYKDRYENSFEDGYTTHCEDID